MKEILVIDDDEGILDAVSAVLEMEGYTVQVSKDSEILKKLDKNPDLILLDVLLSGEDGRDVCKKLKTDTKTNTIPVIMFSADPNVEKDIHKCLADDFLSKPFEIDQLLVKIKGHTK